MDTRDNTVTDLPDTLCGMDLTDQARWADGIPYHVFDRLRREAPVLWHPPGQSADGEGFWVLSRHADIAAAAADPRYSARGGGSRIGGGSHLDDLVIGVHAGVFLPMMDNPRHDLLKQLLGPAVTGPAATRTEPALRAAAESLVDAAVAKGQCDFATDVAEPYAINAIARLLGAPPADTGQLVAWGHRVVGFVNRRTGLVDDESRTIFSEIQRYGRELIAYRRANPDNDLTTVLALGELADDSAEPPLSEYERELNFNLLMLTGAEQPRNTICGGIQGFTDHPGQWQALRTDRSLLPTAVEEMLRWAPPNPYNRRTVTTDLRLHDALLRAGDKVTLWWPSANRDGTVFAGPSQFDIRRSPNPHLSFGTGTHYCLGNEVARLEIRVLLEVLLDRVADIRRAGGFTFAPSNKHTVTLDMPVELVPAA